jgi:hypothetical protein
VDNLFFPPHTILQSRFFLNIPPLEICRPGPGPLWPVRKYGPAWYAELSVPDGFEQWRTEEFFFRLRTEGREESDLGAVAPCSEVPPDLQISETRCYSCYLFYVPVCRNFHLN